MTSLARFIESIVRQALNSVASSRHVGLGLAFVLLANSGTGQSSAPRGLGGIDVLDYQISLSLPDRGNRISGVARLVFLRTRPTDTLVLDLVGMSVDQVSVNGWPARYIRDSATVRIALRPAKANGGEDTVAVSYAGEPADGLIIRTDSLGRWTGFGDNWPTRARYWIPSRDNPADKATVTWLIAGPVGRKVVANGELVEENPRASIQMPDGISNALTVWRESKPIPVYLMVIAAAPLAYFDLGQSACGQSEFGGCVRQSVYVAPEQRRFLPGPFAHAGAIVEYFSTLAGPFPYEKLAHLQSSTKFGGMENASAIFYSDKGFRDGTMGTGVIAHEIAHQWFGDAVTPARFADLWLSEGFATYFEELWVRHSAGDAAFRRSLSESRAAIIASEDVATRPVIDSAETDYLKLLNANSYAKGGWTLHMLRGMLGDSAFFRGVRSYYLKHRHANALTGDLLAELEASSGKELGWFFRQWLERPGFVELTTSWTYDKTTKRVRVRVDQGARFGAYRFPLTVAVRDKSGERRTTVEIPAQRTTTVTLPLDLPNAPTGVVMDPDVALLARFHE